MVNPSTNVETYEINLSSISKTSHTVIIKISAPKCPAARFEPNELIFSRENYKQ